MADGYISQIKTPDNKVYLLKDSEKTDENVKQSSNTEDKEFPIILKNTNNITNETAGVKYVGGVTVNPSEKTVTADEFIGNIKTNKIIPAVKKTWASTSYYATAANQVTSTWFFMSIKPDSWYTPWRVRFKIHTYCPGHLNCDSVTYSTYSGRADSLIVHNWNERYDHAHYYTTIRLLKNAGFNAGLGHALGITILYSNSYTNSGYYRTFELEYYDCDGCTVTVLDNPVLWTGWANGTDTNYNGYSNSNAVDRGLQESGDATGDTSDRTLQTPRYLRFKSGAAGIGRYTIVMEESTGTYSSISTTFATTNNPTTITNMTMNTAVKYKIGRIFWHNQNYNRAANTNIGYDAQYWQQYDLIDIRYSFKVTAGELTAYAPFYMVGTLDDDGLFTLNPAATAWTQTLPASANGNTVYIFLGTVYPDTNTYRVALELHHPIYKSANKQVNPGDITGNAATASSIALSGVTGANDLKAIEAISDTATGLLKKTGENTWSLDTNKYVTSSGITSVTIGAISPVQSSTSTAQTGSSASTTISLKDAYGDTKNPYGTKAKNLVLAGPSSGNNAAPTFRALVTEDIPVTFTRAQLINTEQMAFTNWLPKYGNGTTIPAKTMALFADGLAIKSPATSSDAGWIRVTGTDETDTVLEIATSDDANKANSEKIVVRQYNSSSAQHEAILLGKIGDVYGATSFPVQVTAPKFIGALQGNADTATNISSQTPTLAISTESNEIKVIDLGNSSPVSGAAQRHAIDFRWYDSHWAIGNLRSGSTPSAGFGFSYSGDSGTTYSNLVTISTAGKITAIGGFSGNLTGTATSAGKWTTARTLTIGNKGQSVDGSGNVSWTLEEIGAAPAVTGGYLPLSGGIMTGNIRRYYSTASTEPLITALANNLDIYLWQVGHGTAAATNLGNNGYKLLYKGTNDSTNNYLQLIATQPNGTETIAAQWDELGNANYNGQVHFNLGTANTTTADRKFTIQGSSSNKLSLGSSGIQAYNSSNAASTLNLQYYGGTLEIGSTSTATAGRNFYGTFDFKSSNGFTYSGISAGSDNTARPIWFSYNGITGRPVYDNDFKYNPSTNTLTIGTGTLTATNYSGNAATATAFSSGTTVKLTGDTTGESDSSTKGWTIETSTKLISGSINNTNPLTSTPGTGKIQYIYNVNHGTTGLFADLNNANSILTFNRHNGNYHSQLGFSSNDKLYYRSFNGSVLNNTTAWKQIAFTDSDISGNAATATAANLTSTANAIAYYTDAAGKFGSKASANGALYATSANGTLQWGTLPIAQGGTGKTSATEAWAALGGGASGKHADSYFVTAKANTPDNAIVRFDGTSGQIQKSGITINDSNIITANASGHSFSNIKIYTHTANAGKTYVGWVKFASASMNDSNQYGNHTFDIHLSRTYNSPSSEVYNLRITVGWGSTDILLLGGKYGGHIMTKFRVVRDNTNHKIYFEYYVNPTYTTYVNTVNIRIICYSGPNLTLLNEVQTEEETDFAQKEEIDLVNGINASIINTTTFTATSINGAGTTGQYLKSNGSSAPTWATFSASTVGLGNVENTKLSTWVGSSNITTVGTISSGTWHGTKITNDYIANPKVTIAGNDVSLGGSLTAATLTSSLGLSNALHFIGITSTVLTDGSTTATLTAKSTNSLSKTTGFVDGDVVMDGDQLREYVWSGSAWRLLGITTSTAYTQPTSTATNTWIAQVSQGTDGKITATTGSLDTSGAWSGNAATATKSGVATIWMYPENNNEINFGGTNTGTTLYFGYRKKDSRAIPTKFVFGSSTGTADLQAKTVYLGSGTTSYISFTEYTGNAATTTAANLTSTANAVAYYTDTAGTFGSKASANGALYAISANGALQWGTLPIAQGGTGVTSFTKNQVILSDNTNGTTGLTSRAYSDSTSAGALSSTSTNFVTERDIYYGLPTLNNAHNYNSSSTYYAPTAGGTAGYTLIGAGTTTAPAWYGGTVMSGSAAANWKTAFNGTTDATFSNAAAVTIAGGLGIAKSIIVGTTATITNDTRSPKFTLTVNDTDKAYLQYNTTDNSIDFIFA